FAQGAWTLSLDAGYLHWAGWRGPYTTVSSMLPLAGPLDIAPPKVQYDDIYSLRAGAEWRAWERDRIRLVVRAGAGFEPSPMPDPPGVTNLLDGDKLIATAGVGLLLTRFLPAPVRLDAHVMAHVVTDRTYGKRVVKTSAPDCAATDAVCGLHDEVRDNTSAP